MENLKINKLYPFKNINGKYTTFDEKVLTDLPVSTVSYHSNSNLFIFLNTFTTKFANDLKETLIKKVHQRGVYQVSKETLSEFYVNPHKTIKFRDVLKLKADPELEFLKKGTRVKITLALTGMWFSEVSFGPYISIDSIEIIKNKSLFIPDDTDSDLEI